MIRNNFEQVENAVYGKGGKIEFRDEDEYETAVDRKIYMMTEGENARYDCKRVKNTDMFDGLQEILDAKNAIVTEVSILKQTLEGIPESDKPMLKNL